jgi:adenylate cyclase
MIVRQKAFSAGLGIALAVFALAIFHWGLLETVELKTVDLRFRIRGPIPPNAPIVIINIDQDSFDELQAPWPWRRTVHGELVRKLKKAGAKIIALDILFTEPKADPREDEAFAAALKEAGNVILGAELTDVPSDFGPKTAINLPIPVLRESALGYGLVNLLRGPDGVVRAATQVFDFQNKSYPDFAYRIYRALDKNAGPSKILSDSDLINFRGPGRSYSTIPYYRVLRDEIDPNFFRGKIVMVGAFAESLHDVFPTPFSAKQPMAGVEIQANILDTIFAGDPIVYYAGPWHTASFAVLCAAAIWISLQLNPLRAFAVATSLAVLFGLGCVFAFAWHRIWFPMTPTLLGVLLSYGGLTLQNYVIEQKERLRYRAQFMKYVSPDVVADILENREGLALSGKRRHITVLFSDVRGFTSISENTSPERVVSFLSQYFAQVTQIVFRHGGTVDKFIGDGMMAVFGAPQSHGDDALRAVRTGLEMIEMVRARGDEWKKVLGIEVSIGVGISTGDAIVGSIGSELRSDYTAIGDTVNLASRLETLTKELGVPILISETTTAEIKVEMPLRPLQHVKVVGREKPLLVYTSAAHLNGQRDFTMTEEPYVQQHK